jgi:hypothetical protein
VKYKRLKVERVRNPAEGGRFWREWEELMDRIAPAHRLYRPEWYAIWSETWGSTGRWTGDLHVLAVRDGNGALLGVHPLGVAKVGPLRAYASAGFNQPARPVLAEIGREAEVGTAIGHHISRRGWPLAQLGPFRANSPACRALLDTLDSRRVPHRLRTREGLALYDPPPPGNENRREILETKFAKKVLYYERRAARKGELETVHYRRPSPEETARLVTDLAEAEKHSWLATASDGGLRFAARPGNDKGAEMWRRLIDTELSPRDQLDCWLTYFDGRPASFVFCLTAGTTRYVLANNFDESLKHLRVGFIPYWHAIDDALERGLEHLDYGSLHLDYKKHWGAEYKDALEFHYAVPNLLARVPVSALWAWRDFRSRKPA